MGGKGGRGGAGARRVRRVKGDAGDGGCPAPSSAPPARDAEPAGGTVRRPFAGGCVSWRRRGSFARRGWSGVCCGGGWAHPRRCGEVFPQGTCQAGSRGGGGGRCAASAAPAVGASVPNRLPTGGCFSGRRWRRERKGEAEPDDRLLCSPGSGTPLAPPKGLSGSLACEVSAALTVAVLKSYVI